ncbi:MAG: 4-alpha-glucanotransferase [Candidatus Acidiferrum sp.]
MKISRRSGILLHPTSLPGNFGIGDLGPESRRFVDLLTEAKQRLWCVLPLSPTGPSNSPYQCRSAFAGNSLLISPEELVERGYLAQRELRSKPQFPSSRVDFTAARSYKESLLKRAFRNFSESADYSQFESKHAWWLDSYALFMALQECNGGAPWTKFDKRIKPSTEAIRYHKFTQYEFFRQWHELRKYCAERDVCIMGDMPFYVEHNSADVWSNQELFDLRKNGEPGYVGGVPPDYFSKNGQLWGNPIYQWEQIERTGFKWWIDRFKATLEAVDLLRLDHFRGFEAFWSVRANQPTARKGRWIKGPGARLFERTRKELGGDPPFVAENLGTITSEVEQLRQQFGFPGMAVLQFGFDEEGTHRPNNYVRELVSFTGTHDNDTTLGWWRSLQRAARGSRNGPERATLHRVKSYLQTHGREIHWSFIQAVLTSVANIAVIPLQDVFGLGTQARMNFPGRARGNWRWRLQNDQIKRRDLERLRDLTIVSGR